MVSGYGFPRHEGGPLFWVSRQDRGRIESELDEIAILSGHGYRRGNVAAILERMREAA
jgi:hypothetical protein